MIHKTTIFLFAVVASTFSPVAAAVPTFQSSAFVWDRAGICSIGIGHFVFDMVSFRKALSPKDFDRTQKFTVLFDQPLSEKCVSETVAILLAKGFYLIETRERPKPSQ